MTPPHPPPRPTHTSCFNALNDQHGYVSEPTSANHNTEHDSSSSNHRWIIIITSLRSLTRGTLDGCETDDEMSKSPPTKKQMSRINKCRGGRLRSREPGLHRQKTRRVLKWWPDMTHTNKTMSDTIRGTLNNLVCANQSF